MREVIREQLGEEETCSYLPEQRSLTRYRIVEGCTPETYQRMLERGWRRFGPLFFRPMCVACQECRSLRVEVDSFEPNRSMRRTLKRNEDLRVIVQQPTVTREHMQLYDRYHADMAGRKGWTLRQSDPIDYLLTFVEGHRTFGHEMLFFVERRLVLVTLVDILPRAISAVYTYYDPDERQRSLGVYSILRQIELARSRQVPYLYLGYRVEGNASMRYKARYRPHQLLEGRPEFNEQPVWSAGPEIAV